jgi:hypothetical protein
MATVGIPESRTAPKFPTIPVPEANPESLHKTCLALKQVVEMLTGGDAKSRDGTQADRFAPHVFVQSTTPTALHEGDMWLYTGSTYTFNVWSGGKWLVIATLPAVP